MQTAHSPPQSTTRPPVRLFGKHMTFSPTCFPAPLLPAGKALIPPPRRYLCVSYLLGAESCKANPLDFLSLFLEDNRPRVMRWIAFFNSIFQWTDEISGFPILCSDPSYQQKHKWFIFGIAASFEFPAFCQKFPSNFLSFQGGGSLFPPRPFHVPTETRSSRSEPIDLLRTRSLLLSRVFLLFVAFPNFRGLSVLTFPWPMSPRHMAACATS